MGCLFLVLKLGVWGLILLFAIFGLFTCPPVPLPRLSQARAVSGAEQSRSEATRAAILAAERAQRRARLRAEAEQLRNDPDDVAASRQLAAEMDAIRTW